MELEHTSFREWIKQRAIAIRSIYTSFQCLNENGHGESVPDETTPVQISCPFHGADNRPSARYYPKSGGRSDYVRCYKCGENWDSINLHAKFRGLRFMDALSDLERRFHVKTPKRPESANFTEPLERKSDYVSDQWKDVPRVLSILERKLISIRDKCSMADYIKFCRVMDAIQYDYDRDPTATPNMISTLIKMISMMDDIVALPSDINAMEGIDDPPS